MMTARRAALALTLIAAACAETTPRSTTPAPAPAMALPTVSAKGAPQSVASFRAVASRIQPVAERLCREENPGRPATYCDFVFVIDTKDNSPANAYQTIGRDGRPILAFNRAMLKEVRNPDEIAFILGHEAGHQISSHIVRQQTSASLGALVLGGLVAGLGGSSQAVNDAANIGGTIGGRVYSKDHEIEADVIGTYVSTLAGYDPLVGAQTFARIASGSDSFLSTHPPGSKRGAAVAQTVRRIEADRAAGRPIRLP